MIHDQSSNVVTKTFIANLKLPTDDIYQMAVAANTADYSSGLVWATCTIIQNKVVSKLKNVKVFDIQNTKAHISWQLKEGDTDLQAAQAAQANSILVAGSKGQQHYGLSF